MSEALEKLKAAVRDFQDTADLDFVDPKELSGVVDSLQGTLCLVLNEGRKRGEYQLARLSPCSWAARTCGMSRNSANDRLCVGKHLQSMPQTSAALASGQIGYQAAICHLRDQLGDKWDPANEAEMVDNARRFSVENLRLCCRHARHVADPDGFDRATEGDFERRWLNVSPMLDGMHSGDGVSDPVTGAAFRAAPDSLALWRGPEDRRNHGQRTADALAEMLEHHLNEGRLPRRKGVRPHVTLTTSLQALKGEV